MTTEAAFRPKVRQGFALVPYRLPGEGLMRAPACLLSLLLAACATSPEQASRPLTGMAGPVTWEITDIGRVVSADNQRVRWSYLITLRNTSDRVIQLERLERAVTSVSSEAVGGTPTSQPFRRTLGARGELRVSTSDNWGWMPGANTTFGGAAILRPITAYRRFSGTDDRGAPIQIQVQVHLDPSVGALAKPPTRPPSLPAPSTLQSAGGLTALVGVWRGSYRYDNTLLDVPIEATILADGTVQLAENEPVTNRFGRTVQVKDGGLDYSGGRERGTLTLHETAGRRMLVGRVSPIEGQPYAVYLEVQTPASVAARPAATSGPPVTSTPVSAPSTAGQSGAIDLTGSYRGTVTGTRNESSYSDRVTVAVIQSGREFSGTWSTPSASGTLTGTVLGRTNFTFRLRQDSPCAAEFGGLGTIDASASRLAASYRGEGCQGSNVAASLIVTREAR